MIHAAVNPAQAVEAFAEIGGSMLLLDGGLPGEPIARGSGHRLTSGER